MADLPHTPLLNRRAALGMSVAGLTALAGCSGTDTDEQRSDLEPNDDEENDDPDPDDGGKRDRNPDQAEGDPERSDAGTLLDIRDTLDTDNPLFDPQIETFSGDTSTVTDEVSLESALTVVAFEHDGEDNFIVEVDGPVSGLVAHSSDTTGAVCLAADRGDYEFGVATDSNWSMTVGQPFAPSESIRTPNISASGNGQTVVGPVELTEATTFTGEHESDDGNFVVEVYNEDASSGSPDEVVFNEIGEFSGETRADPAGVAWIQIEAVGVWRLEIE